MMSCLNVWLRVNLISKMRLPFGSIVRFVDTKNYHKLMIH